MDIVAVLSLSLAPGILWLWFFSRRDREPEPKRLLFRMFFFGMLAMPAAALLERPLRGHTFLQVVLLAPLIEEGLKLLILRFTIYRHERFRRPVDGIIYAAAVALGFAAAENAFYMVVSYLAPQIALGMSDPLFALGLVWKLYVFRALLTVPGHAIWSAMGGYALGWSRFVSPSRRIVLKGFLLSVGLHAVFNYLIINQPVTAVGMLILVPVMWKMLYARIERALAKSFPPEDDNTEGKARRI